MSHLKSVPNSIFNEFFVSPDILPLAHPLNSSMNSQNEGFYQFQENKQKQIIPFQTFVERKKCAIRDQNSF